MSRLLVLGLFLVTACARPAPSPPARGFYAWRTRFSLSDVERDALGRLHVTKLYLRLFDVARRNGAPVPVGRVQLDAPLPAGVEVVPVVFLTNETLLHEADPAALAGHVWAEVKSFGLNFTELQLDCDWTPQSRATWFRFLEVLRGLAGAESVRLSSTIRLHQVKYAARTGVPPVERGMLMFYNVGTLEAGAARPSIFNAEDAAKYVATLDDYPLPLDVALPVFSWAVHERGERVVGLVEKPDLTALRAEPALVPEGGEQFRATRDLLWAGAHLAEGDVLRLERMTPERTRQAAALLDQSFHPRGPSTRVLFDLDERNLATHTLEELDALLAPRP